MRVCRLVCLSTAALLATVAVANAQDVPGEPTGITTSGPAVPGETPTTDVVPPTGAVDPGVTSQEPPVTSPEVPPVTSPEVPPVTSPEVPPVTSPEVPPVTSPEVPPVTSPEVPTTPDPGAVTPDTPVQPSPDPAASPSLSEPLSSSSVDSAVSGASAPTDSAILASETPLTGAEAAPSDNTATLSGKPSNTNKTSSPSSTSTTNAEEGNNMKSGKSISGGAIAGIVIAVVAAFALLLGYLFWRRRQQRKAYLESSVDYNEFPEYDPTSMSDPHISQSATHDPAAAGFYGEKSGQFDHHIPADDHLGGPGHVNVDLGPGAGVAGMGPGAANSGASVFDISPHHHHDAISPRHMD
ncbi:hypothetical protein LPJ64_005207 [Coemansia asiatica]|uniref:Mid2 domain-containing protein n=1 Tax=Coemansia asiatica TaxID=1052880 RepID=A0A9W8CID5_9FUNG|nr:hypothetical protein LPJ64_005207 [Coemansia asiatica]